jgi:4-amino-4-deoxy-L-arabinose transferase-like glycosyltransferase
MKIFSRPLFHFFLLAFAIRLAFGAFAYYALPVLGYDSPVENAGYLFYDASRRDTAAWELAQSGRPLMEAFSGQYESDQYGGLLALSALLYRLIPSDAHQPLWVVTLAALAGGLGVVFAVLAAGQALGESAARRVGWVMSLLPESVLLGAAQMREPFIILFLAMGFYGLLAWRKTPKPALGWAGLALLGLLTISPGFAALLVFISLGWLFFEGRQISWKFLLAGLAVFGLALAALAVSWDGLVSVRGGPLGIFGDWARETIRWNKYILGRSSGIVQLLFETLPGWLALPFVAVYGILQPVLPAAIVEPALPFWQTLGVFRAAGWYALLPILGYAPFAAWRLTDPRQRRQWLWIAAVVWVWVLVAALRGGGDQWDNPRYRIILLVWMAMLAALACEQLKISRDRWFLRILAVEAIILVVFGHWYLYRYVGLGFNLGIRNTLILALGLSVLAVAGDWVWARVGQGRREAGK